MPDDTRGEQTQPALPEGSYFEGVLLASGPARIEGRVRGPVIGTSSLEIGAAAEIEGPVEAREILVAGRVTGDLVASQRVALAASARVKGRIATPRLSAAEGAQVDGRARVGEFPKPRDEPATP